MKTRPKGDLLLIALVVIVALGGLLHLGRSAGTGDGGVLEVEIYVAGELSQRLPLPARPEELRIETRQGTNLLRLGPAGAAVVEADCANQACVHTGQITQAGGVIVCLPHQLLIRLVSQTGGGFDAIAY